MAKVIGIISLKGGVGKTTTVANLSACLAWHFGRKVLAIDANFSAPNLGIHFGIIDPKTTIHHVLNNRAHMHEAIHSHDLGLHVVPASYFERKVNPFRLRDKISSLREQYDFILLDSSPNLNDEVLATMVASDELFVVTTPDYPTLSTTLRAVKLARQRKTRITGLILNKVRGKSFELSASEIEEAAGIPVISMIPDDIRVLESVAHTTPVSVLGTSSASIEYRKLAAMIAGCKYSDPRLWKRLLSLLVRK